MGSGRSNIGCAESEKNEEIEI
ncbi:uncharacterized protein G2W53_024310 [Senna tora]|uniref:Uncharacterized protein n=1 Tax=Senna tora TaxID=362788 RepID=A0A834WD04_9FABA|nr:uncharacterized protein G2W53_024310 [Senna tora]